MRLELKRVDMWSAIKVSFCVNIILGFLLGIVYALFLGMFAGLLSSLPGGEGLEGVQMSFGILIIVMPFMFAFFLGVVYTVVTAICVALYNFMVKFTGGMEFTFQQIAELQPPPPSQYGNYIAQPPSYGPPPISPYAPPPQHPEPPRGDKGADL